MHYHMLCTMAYCDDTTRRHQSFIMSKALVYSISIVAQVIAILSQLIMSKTAPLLVASQMIFCILQWGYERSFADTRYRTAPRVLSGSYIASISDQAKQHSSEQILRRSTAPLGEIQEILLKPPNSHGAANSVTATVLPKHFCTSGPYHHQGLHLEYHLSEAQVLSTYITFLETEIYPLPVCLCRFYFQTAVRY